MAKRVKTAPRRAVEGKATNIGKAVEPKRGREAKERVEPKRAARTTALVPRASDSATPATVGRTPFAFMRSFADQMDRLFDDFRLGTTLLPRLELPFERREVAELAWMPVIEVSERGGKLVVRADLPGLSKDDVKVEVREDAVCIRGERRQEREEKRKGFYRSERSYGSFYREIPLPEGIDPDQATASFRNGVLEVALPAPPKPAKGRQVPIDQN